MTTSDRFQRLIPRMFAAVRFVLIVLNNGGGNLRHAYAQNLLPYVEQVPVSKYAQAIEDGRVLLQALVESSKRGLTHSVLMIDVVEGADMRIIQSHSANNQA
jgi:hypothetical protein